MLKKNSSTTTIIFSFQRDNGVRYVLGHEISIASRTNAKTQDTPPTMYGPDKETDKNQTVLPTSLAEPVIGQSVPILNANMATTCNMCREDLVQVLEQTKYGVTNQAMFNAYFQAGSSPPLCIACMRPLQHHQSRTTAAQQPNTNWQGLGYGGLYGATSLPLNHIPKGIKRTGSIDQGELRGTNNLLFVGRIFFGVSLVLWIVFTSVGLFNISPVFFLQPTIFSCFSLVILFFNHSSYLSFDHSSRTFSVKKTKGLPCLGGIVANGSFDDIVCMEAQHSCCMQNRRPVNDIILVLRNGNRINLGKQNAFISISTIGEWNHYIKQSLHGNAYNRV